MPNLQAWLEPEVKCGLFGDHQATLYAEPMSLGQNIRRARLAAGLTQAALGKAVGRHSAQTVSQWELGETVPDARKLSVIAKTCKTTVAALHDEKPGLSDEDRAILGLLGALKPQEKDRWIRALKAFFEE